MCGRAHGMRNEITASRRYCLGRLYKPLRSYRLLAGDVRGNRASSPKRDGDEGRSRATLFDTYISLRIPWVYPLQEPKKRILKNHNHRTGINQLYKPFYLHVFPIILQNGEPTSSVQRIRMELVGFALFAGNKLVSKDKFLGLQQAIKNTPTSTSLGGVSLIPT